MIARARASIRYGVAVLSLASIAGCGGQSAPTAPDTPPPAVVQLGSQLFTVGPSTPPCGGFSGTAPSIGTRVTLAWSGSEWVGTAASAAAGDVELHFRPAGTAAQNGQLPVAGNIKGTAIHLPELFVGFPPYNARVNFGSDNRATLSGAAAPAGSPLPYSYVEGTGVGPATFSGDAGTCASAAFSWRLVSITANR